MSSMGILIIPLPWSSHICLTQQDSTTVTLYGTVGCAARYKLIIYELTNSLNQDISGKGF